MTAASTSRFARTFAPALVIFALLPGCGVFATQKSQDELTAKNEALEKTVKTQEQEMQTLKSDLQAERDRLDNALRANADRGTDILGTQARVNALAGRMDESAHAVDEMKKELAASRAEVDAKLDDLKRVSAVQPQQPPPVQIPADKSAHFAATETAYNAKDWSLARTLGREYENRYPNDDKVDDVAFMMGDADLQDGKPSSALGEFNRVLKANPPSNVLDKTLLDMGAAYMLMHDCESAKLAYTSAEKRFSKDKTGAEARKRLAVLAKPTPEMCSPQ
jgi:TolA-binding protein